MSGRRRFLGGSPFNQLQRQAPAATLINGEIPLSNLEPRLAYRPDIDGLRDVAVLLVIAYHLVALKIWGGFVGVYVFFVISGFLSSSVILREIEEGRFSLLAFNERRIRRMFPCPDGDVVFDRHCFLYLPAPS